MSVWGEIFLGIIAVATLASAIVQIGLIVAAASLARRLDRLASQVERELKPIFGHLDAIGRDASRAAAVAAAQVERADRLLADLGQRVEETAAAIQASLLGPAREGRALLSAFKAVFAALRGLRTGRRHRGEDEDALFI